MKYFVKIIALTTIILLCFSLCGCEIVGNILSDQEYVAENGDKGSYVIKNALKEEYRVEYQERLGLKDRYYDYQVYYSDSKILSYSVKIREKEHFKPSKMLFLFSADNCYYYYYACDKTDYIYEAIAVYDVESTERSEYSFKKDSEEIQKILRDCISRKELEDKIYSCEYSENILELYGTAL